MASLKSLVGDTKPVIAYPKTIQFGPIELQGYMLENGEFRQSIRSTEVALGAEGSRMIARMFAPRGNTVPRFSATAPLQNSLQQQESEAVEGQTAQGQSPVILPVHCPGVMNHNNNVAYTVNLPMVVEIWKQIALSDSKYSRTALELLGLSAVHSLERTYQEAFGVEDDRSTQDRLVDWAIRLDAGRHFPLFGNQFNQHFARVTGRCVGYDSYAAVCLADLVYHRLPEPIYEKLKEINKRNPSTGRREHTYAQLMTEDMLAQMREVVATVTNQLANTASRVDDPKDYPRLLKRLDKTLPRYKTRANKQRGVYPEHLKRYNEAQKALREEQNDNNQA